MTVLVFLKSSLHQGYELYAQKIFPQFPSITAEGDPEYALDAAVSHWPPHDHCRLSERGHAAVPLKPALQTQDINAVLETGEVESAGQDEHADVPLEVVYFPDSQFVHALDPAVTEYEPA